MAQGYPSPQISVVEQPGLMFSEEELNNFLYILKVEENLIEIRCGCTSIRHGDFGGTLTIHRDGSLCVSCHCFDGCHIENATPEDFADHAKSKLMPSQWPRCIWVQNLHGNKIKLYKTPLLKYFQNVGKGAKKDHQKFKFHRDEFMRCSECGIERRFILKDTTYCRAYHDAALMPPGTWTCSMHPNNITCNSHGKSRTKLFTGCPTRPSCKGCSKCACMGCADCRFLDCGCRDCVDFISNNNA